MPIYTCKLQVPLILLTVFSGILLEGGGGIFLPKYRRFEYAHTRPRIS